VDRIAVQNKQTPVTFKGRRLGITLLVIVQILIGIIHTVLGLMLLGSRLSSGIQNSIIYSTYTIVFGLLTLVFALLIWKGNKLGWSGTIGLLFFVTVVDILTALNLPSIPGIPRFAVVGEIPYSLFVIFYLLQPEFRRKLF
jgi:hypothetical protein